MTEHKDSLDSIFQNFRFDFKRNDKSKLDGKPVSIWLSREYKAKYDELQIKSDKQFGKLVKELIKQAIDKSIQITSEN